MEGLLERLARLSLNKSSKLLKQGGRIGGAVLGNMAAPGVGGYLGAQAGEALGNGVGSSLEALSESGRRNPSTMQINNLGSYQQQPTFAQNWANNLAPALGGQAVDMAGDYFQNPESQEGMPEEEQSVASQLEQLLDSLSPEERNSILAKYTGAQ